MASRPEFVESLCGQPEGMGVVHARPPRPEERPARPEDMG